MRFLICAGSLNDGCNFLFILTTVVALIAVVMSSVTFETACSYSSVMFFVSLSSGRY